MQKTISDFLKTSATCFSDITSPVKIANGSFGTIYKAFDKKTNSEIAIKIEQRSDKIRSTLKNEALILKTLSNTPGVPKLISYTKEADYSSLIMPMYGLDTKELFSHSFTVRQAFEIISQTLDILEKIHSKRIVHRDLKPANIVLACDGKSYILIDFGLAGFFHSGRLAQNKNATNSQFLGNVRFSSAMSHFGQEMTRRDDLESLGYILLYFVNGNLPWDNLSTFIKDDRIKKVGEMKAALNLHTEFPGLPEEIFLYFEYVKTLGFEEKPDYKYLGKMLDLARKKMEAEEKRVGTPKILSPREKIPRKVDSVSDCDEINFEDSMPLLSDNYDRSCLNKYFEFEKPFFKHQGNFH